MIRFIDLFCGIGGFRLGLERANSRTDFVESHKGQHKETEAQSNGGLDVGSNELKAGYHCVWSSDIDRYARQIYKKNFSEEPEGDITQIPAESVPDHDLLCAGFPCQAFSIAGKRKGFQDPRGTLFFDITRILSHKRPRYFLLENVDGLLSDDDGKTFQTILRILTDIGYLLQSEVLNSKNYSVPQSRKRVFIIGHLRGERRPEIFPIGEIHKESFEGSTKTTTVRALTGGAHSGGHHSAMTLLKKGQVGKKDNMGQRIYDPEGVACSIRSQSGGQGAKTGLYEIPKISKTIRATYGKAGNVGNANWRSGKYQFVGAIRCLTPVECERLQGFPDNWTEGVSDTQRYKLLGNAVTVNVIEFLGERLKQEVFALNG